MPLSERGANRLELRNVSKKFCASRRQARLHAWSDLKARVLGRVPSSGSLRDGEYWVFRGASFSLRSGESLAILGLNGAGKSTLLKLIAGRLLPSEGRVESEGAIASLTAAGLGFRMNLTGRENVYLSGAVHGRSRAEMDARMDHIAEFAGIGEFLDRPVGIYSSGMTARLGFAITVAIDPDILLVDEALAVGDLTFQRRCLAYARDFLSRGGILVLVTHDTHLAASICQSSLLIHQGAASPTLPVTEGIRAYVEAIRAFEAASRPHRVGAPETARAEDPKAEAAEARILDLGIEGEGGPPLSGGIATFFMRCWARKPVGANFGLVVETDDGERVVVSLGRAPGEPAVSLPEGVSEIRARVRFLPLAPGAFVLRGFLIHPETSVAYCRDVSAGIRIGTPGTQRAGQQLRLRQVSVIEEPDWHVRPC